MFAKILVKCFGPLWQLKSCTQNGKNSFVRKLSLKIYQAYQYENGASIAWNSEFQSPPCFPHGIAGIFISGGAKIGKDCVIFQQVTIGSNMLLDSKNSGSPVIGDNVYIGAGAKIIGNVTIGNNVRIGANAVVHTDVPDNSVVVSGETRIIQKDAPLDNTYYTYIDGWKCFENGEYKNIQNKDTLEKLEKITKYS